MSVRPPKAFAPKSQASPFEEALDHEIRGEMAGTHGRLMEVLQKRLAALAAFDERAPDVAPSERDPLVAAAGEALWHIIVQRELMGLRRPKSFMDEFGVPPEVRLRMGIRPKPADQ